MLFFFAGTWPTSVSVANMLCRLTTTMLLAPNVGWLLAIVVWILRIPALPVKDGLGSSGQTETVLDCRQSSSGATGETALPELERSNGGNSIEL